MGMRYGALSLAVLVCFGARAAEVNLLKNGDFESVNGKTIAAWGYNRRVEGIHGVDSTIRHGGSYSLRIGGVKGYDAFTNHSGAIEEFKDDLLIRGWVKYDKLVKGMADGRMRWLPFIGIWTNNANGSNNVSFPALTFEAGTRDWFYFEKVIRVSEVQKEISSMRYDRRPARWAFRINVASQPGTVWFDDLELVALPRESQFKVSLDSQSYLSASYGEISVKVDPEVLASSPSRPQIEFRLSDRSGKLLRQWRAEVCSAVMKESFELETLASGTYTLTVLPGAVFASEAVTLSFEKLADAFEE